jgi:hypothetical protein
MTDICNNTTVPQQITDENLTLTKTILKQNYFQFHEQTYRQTTGLAMGATTSSILAEVYLQHTEHGTLYDMFPNHFETAAL